MQSRSFKPSPRYLTKLRLAITVLTLVSIVGCLLFALIIPDRVARLFFLSFIGAGIIVWLVAVILAGPYFGSLGYEVQDDEVIVRVGIFTHSVMSYGRFDRTCHMARP